MQLVEVATAGEGRKDKVHSTSLYLDPTEHSCNELLMFLWILNCCLKPLDPSYVELELEREDPPLHEKFAIGNCNSMGFWFVNGISSRCLVACFEDTGCEGVTTWPQDLLANLFVA